jgi:hypothetical protein
MSQSNWEKYKLSEKVLEILDIESYEPNHHFGRPFVTAYQIAILLKKMFPDTFARLNQPLGGQGTGYHHSLAQYLARNLSQQIKRGSLPKVEGRFINMQNIGAIAFNDFGEIFEASQLSNISMFRRID